MEMLCDKCSNRERGCRHDPEYFSGEPIPHDELVVKCVHKTCSHGVEAGIYNQAKMKTPLRREIDGVSVEVWPISTVHKPTVIYPEALPPFGSDGRRRDEIARSREVQIQAAGTISEEAQIVAQGRERVCTAGGEVYSADHGGILLRTGQNIHCPDHTLDLVVRSPD